MLLSECTQKCGRRTDTGSICRYCLNEINTTVHHYIVLKASTKKLAEELLEWWYS